MEVYSIEQFDGHMMSSSKTPTQKTNAEVQLYDSLPTRPCCGADPAILGLVCLQQCKRNIIEADLELDRQVKLYIAISNGIQPGIFFCVGC